MQIQRCIGCMEEITAYPCPRCGFSPETYDNKGSYLQPNTILHGKYLIGRVLGQGGFGITYLGLDLAANARVAIKEFFPDGQVMRDPSTRSSLHWGESEKSQELRRSGVDTFLREARKMARVSDVPAVVNIQEIFTDNETAYIVMEYVEGETFSEYLNRTGPLSWERAREIFLPAVSAMEQVHRAGLIHRDLSPDNLMLRRDGSVKILDLGAAKDLKVNSGASSMLVAKTGFSPIEQYIQRGNSGPWTDVYAMAATLYYALTGRVPPASIERMDQDTLDWNKPGLQSLSPKMLGALQYALEVSSKKRMQDMTLLRATMEAEDPGTKRTAPADHSSTYRYKGKKSVPSGEYRGQKTTPSGKNQEQKTTPSGGNQGQKTAPSGEYRGQKTTPSDRNQGQNPRPSAGSQQPKAAPSPKPQEKKPEPSPNPREKKASRKVSFGAILLRLAVVVAASLIGSAILNSGNKEPVSAKPALRITPGMSVATTPMETAPVVKVPVSIPEGAHPLGDLMDIPIRKAVSISFVGDLEAAPEDARDASLDQDGSILAWMEGNALTIGTRGTIVAPENMSLMFAACSRLESIDFSALDTSHVTRMAYLFSTCTNLKKVDVSGFDTSNVTDMSSMFKDCTSLTELDLSAFRTLGSTSFMFKNCSSLTTLDLSGVESIHQVQDSPLEMFIGCSRLNEPITQNEFILESWRNHS